MRLFLIIDEHNYGDPKFYCRRGLEYNREFWEKFINETYSTVNKIFDYKTFTRFHCYEISYYDYYNYDLDYIRKNKYFDYFYLFDDNIPNELNKAKEFLKFIGASNSCTI